MLEIYSIIRNKKESQILIICKLNDDKDLEIIAFIISSLCNSHFCIEYTHKEVLKFLKKLIEKEDIFGKFVAFGIGLYQGKVAFFFGKDTANIQKTT